MKYGKLAGYLLSVSILVVTGFAYFERQNISDWLKLRSYNPAQEIESLANDTALTDEGKKLFYVHDPDLLDKEAFFGKCNEKEKSSVLGCYYSHNKIYLLKVSEPKLDGIEEVTAAHEMLHAAFDRLGTEEKDRISRLLEEVYNNLPEGSQVKKDIATYDTTDSKVFYNELHSIIGTELRDLPEELEKHYSLYFRDRSLVINFAEKYAGEFNRLQSRIIELDAQLDSLKIELDEAKINLEFLYSAIEDEGRALERKANDPDAYNAAIPSYNAKVIEYRNLSSSYNGKVEIYNRLIEERKSIAVENNQLYDAIDTRLPVVE